ncbi:efflux RND transporter permease subunit [Candidatus Pseudothioglobus sp. Uisw_086]|uniref:efflux RND transporter permease subunit n=1 Tax=Candidatus Pseudothioglobus sp. Uisw_086 TaxID=3230998 RepID=UPI00230FEEF0|nr:efflux RND transporter permease subunit [Candidatus Thioglobus sp.]MDB4038518.1 efflux RND transporter permease subunit [Candidatus Thioglobus sp.]
MKNLLLYLNHYFAKVPGQLIPYRKTVLALALLSTIFMGYGASRFVLDTSFDVWFSESDPAIEALDDFRDQFGSDDGLFIVYEAKDGDVFSNKSLTLISEITEVLDNYRQISDDVWLEKYGLTPEIVESLTHIKRVQSLSNIRIQKNEDDVLSSPRLVPKKIPSDALVLSEISSEADNQPSLPLFMFSKDHRFGAISIQTDFGAIPVIQELNDQFSLFDDDAWSDDFDEGMDDNAVIQKIEYQPDEPGLYIPFMKAITAITEQQKMSEHFNFYPIGNSAMISLAMDTLIQAAFLLVGMVAIINLLLWSLFRSASAVVLPQLAIGLSILFVIGSLSWLNLASTTLIALTVMLIIAVGVADCVHVMSSYLFFRRDGKEHDEALSKAYGKTGVPILLTTITTMAGMSSLAVTGMPMFVQFGFSSAAGVFFAFLYTIYLLPVLLNYWHPMQIKKIEAISVSRKTGIRSIVSLLKSKMLSFLCFFVNPIAKLSKRMGLNWLLGAEWLQPLLNRIPAFVERFRYSIAIIFVSVFVICLYGATQVKIDSNLVELYSDDVPIGQAYEIVDEHMMGTGNMEIVVDTAISDGIMDPDVLNAMNRLQNTIEENYSEFIIRTNSLADLVIDTHAIMQDSEDYRNIPDSQIAVSQLLYLFNSSNPEERRALVSDDYSKSHISVQLKNAGSNEYKVFFKDIQRDINKEFNGLKDRYPNIKVQITGSFALMMRLADDISKNQFKSLAIAAVVISLLLMITLGSFQAGVMSIIPNLIPASLAFGLMGLLGVPLDTDTLMIAPLIIGIAVDDTIHFISHYRMSLAQNHNMKLALVETIKEVGQAVTFTTLILGCGFLMLTFSDYLGLAKIGTFGSLAIFVALLCDLLFFPALIMIFKPKFGQKDVEDNLNFIEATK